MYCQISSLNGIKIKMVENMDLKHISKCIKSYFGVYKQIRYHNLPILSTKINLKTK